MKYHGVDLHKKYATISVRDEAGNEERFVRAQHDIGAYVSGLGNQDAVVLEASAGALYWADKIQDQGATCAVIDAYRFRIICDSWQKTDRRDAANLSLGLWLASCSKETKLPVIWQPTPVIRELRKLFGLYDLLNKQIRQLKNEIHGALVDNGVRDLSVGTRITDSPARGEQLLQGLQLSPASRVCILFSLTLLAGLQERKQALRLEISRAGQPLEAEVKLLISIRGVTPLLALAFLADAGDIQRFKSARRLHAYLGVVPTVRSSGGVTHNGRINRRSRLLCRTLFTQSVIHLVDSSPVLKRYYRQIVIRRGYGRARIALLRKTFTMMRRMLLSRELYRWTEPELYQRKLKEYGGELAKGRGEAAA
jgi:transposase